MNVDAIATRFRDNLATIESLTANIPDEQARWKPSDSRWSILEVMCHLVDEERDDFRRRLDLLLNHPGDKWPAIDPEGWAVERHYNTRNLETVRGEFRTERERSISWLAAIGTPDWGRTYAHPLGDISAGSLLASWLVHDFLHTRQLARLHFDHVRSTISPHTVDYAGRW